LCHCHGAKGTETTSTGKTTTNHALTFAKVFDGRKQPIRGLGKEAGDSMPN